MIAFVYYPTSGQYWAYDILMRPNDGDLIIDPEGNKWHVEKVIMNFSERIGPHYGIIVSSVFKGTSEDNLCKEFQQDVTNDIFFNRPGLAIGNAEEGAESRAEG